ncbi:MAG: HemK/PrmC family methyltransferase [bacterium]
MLIREALTGSHPQERLDILSHLIGYDKAWLLAHPETELPENIIKEYAMKLEQLKDNFPLAYILGSWTFHNHEFKINRHVLIPRPETELLVTEALKIINEHNLSSFSELGTGSGCVTISLLLERPNLIAYAVDINNTILHIAKENANRYKVRKQITFHKGNLIKPLQSLPPLIIANLPYLTYKEHKSNTLLHQEPKTAFITKDGMEIFIRLKKQLEQKRFQGWLLLEIDPRRSEQLKKLFGREHTEVVKDQNNWDRVLKIKI